MNEAAAVAANTDYAESSDLIGALFKAIRLIPKQGFAPKISYKGNFPEPIISDESDFFDEVMLDEIANLNLRRTAYQQPTKPKSFEDLVLEWKNDTRGLSSISEIVMHPAYQTILARGKDVLPEILHDLQKNGGVWFHALYYLADQYDAAAGTKTIADATAAWIEWGYKNNYI